MNVNSRAVLDEDLENHTSETVLMHLTPSVLRLELRVCRVPYRGLALRRPGRFVAACLPTLPLALPRFKQTRDLSQATGSVTFHTVDVCIIRLAVMRPEFWTIRLIL